MNKNIDRDFLDEKHNSVPADYYDQSIAKNLFQRYWHQRRYQKVKKIFRESENLYREILDIGCHSGRFTHELFQETPSSHFVGIDISSEAIKYAKDKYKKNKKKFKNLDFVTGKAEKLPFPNNKFDRVTCFEVLEHLKDPQSVIREAGRVLKNKGEFLIMIPTENFLFKIIWFFWSNFGRGRVWQHTHVQKFSHGRLDHLLENEGFLITKKKLFSIKNASYNKMSETVKFNTLE